jgi:cellulose synthase/poly-beta-1,6-N-acetylglucosamine synthase-like glycosyltransferase
MAALLIALLCLFLAQRIALALACLLPPPARPAADELPGVQVLVAARDEQRRLPRLLAALERLDYEPAKLAFVLVSDGSRDGTAELMEEWCAGRPRALTVRLRETAGKSAALQIAWMRAPGEEITVVYDADVQPAPGSLRALAGEFADPRIGAAGGPVWPSNPECSMVSRYAALELWSFHGVGQRGRHRLGLQPFAIGANCAFRSAALAAIGGFPRSAVSEDVETSFAVIRQGWRTSFRPEAVVVTEVPVTLRQFWRQRQRWTRGLHLAARGAPGLAGLLVVAGYTDRLVLLALAVAACLGAVSWWWPALYFAGPAATVGITLAQNHPGRRLAFLLRCLPMFAADLAVTVWATLLTPIHRTP